MIPAATRRPIRLAMVCSGTLSLRCEWKTLFLRLYAYPSKRQDLIEILEATESRCPKASKNTVVDVLRTVPDPKARKPAG